MMKNRWSLNLALAALGLLLMPSLVSGAESLLIAVASDDVEATSLVSNFAASSRYYLLFSGTNFVQVVNNPFLQKGPGAAPLVVDYLAQKGVGVVVAVRFGPLMIEAMNMKGMKYIQFSGVAQEAAERVVNFLRPSKKDGKMGTQ
jgi:predicted Fe-Mo cluster-binding NifX family protein